MKIHKIKNIYKCDRCGVINTRDNTYSLSSTYQASGPVEYKKRNLGVRHLCKTCKPEYEKHFESFFISLNKIINDLEI